VFQMLPAGNTEQLVPGTLAARAGRDWFTESVAVTKMTAAEAANRALFIQYGERNESSLSCLLRRTIAPSCHRAPESSSADDDRDQAERGLIATPLTTLRHMTAGWPPRSCSVLRRPTPE